MTASHHPHRPHRRIAASLAASVLLASLPAAALAPAKVSTLEDIRKEFDAVPCDDNQRLAAVKALFEGAGAAASEVAVETFDDVQNLVVVKPGETAERIVVGAHYDKVADGCGAVDNWTGQVALAHLYRTLRDLPMKKTLVFVAFGREEKGLVGSRAMARAIPGDGLAQYCAMVNIDSLGLGSPQVADNMSSKALAAFAGEVAKELQIPFAHASIGRANSDSSSFVARKIPAVTIHGLSKNWPKILHSSRDQASKVNPASVYLGYRLALAMVVRLDQSACDAYR